MIPIYDLHSWHSIFIQYKLAFMNKKVLVTDNSIMVKCSVFRSKYNESKYL